MADCKRLRIALAIGTLDRGGTETQLVGLARELHARGHEVEVLALSAWGPLHQELVDAGVPTWCANIEGFRRFRECRNAGVVVRDNALTVLRVLRLFAHVARGRYDVLHAFLFHSYILLMPWAWLVRIPVRVSGRRGLHASLPRSRFSMSATRLSIAASTVIAANSEAVAADAVLRERVPSSKIRVIYNGLSIPEHTADPGVEPPEGLLVANLIEYKGHLDLVEAVDLLPEYVRDRVRIRCVGEGVMRSEIEHALNVSDLTDRVVLTGSLPARSLYSEAQYGLLVSREEGLPNAIMEAMAAGLPVVATDVGGCRELVEHGVTGLLVPPNDRRALSEAIQRVVVDSTFRVRAGLAARDRAKSFGWDRMVRAHVDLYGARSGC